MNFSRKLKSKEFIKTAEIVPPKDVNIEKQIDKALLYKDFVDAIDITDCPMANIRLSSFCLGKIIQEKTGLEAIFNFTCRDRNIIGIESDLLGAFSLGVKNILCLWGDPPELGNRPDAKAIYEVNTLELIKISKEIGFNAGVAGSVSLEKGNLKNIEGKVSAGADFMITQPVYTKEKVLEAKKIEKEFKIAVLLGILPPNSAKMAENINKNVPGITIPSELINKIKREEENASVDNAKEIIRLAKKNLSGVHIMLHGNDKMIKKLEV